MNVPIESIFSALASGLLVVLWSQWRQDRRHNDLRSSEKEEKKLSAFEQSQVRQLEAVSTFVQDIKDLENANWDSWFESAKPNTPEATLRVNNIVRNLNFYVEVKAAIDLLDLQIVNPKVRARIQPLRDALGDYGKESFEHSSEDAGLGDGPWIFKKEFTEARKQLLDMARAELRSIPEPPFTPFLTYSSKKK